MPWKSDREISIWRKKNGRNVHVQCCKISQVNSLPLDTLSFLLDDWGPLPNSYRGHQQRGLRVSLLIRFYPLRLDEQRCSFPICSSLLVFDTIIVGYYHFQMLAQLYWLEASFVCCMQVLECCVAANWYVLAYFGSVQFGPSQCVWVC